MPQRKKNQANYKEYITFGLAFAIEYPIVVVILAILAVIFSVVITLGFYALATIPFALLLAAFLLVRNRWIIPKAPMTASVLFAIIWTLYNIYNQYQSCSSSNFGIFSFLQQGYCQLNGVVNLPQSFLYFFIPSFIVFGFILWLFKLKNGR